MEYCPAQRKIHSRLSYDLSKSGEKRPINHAFAGRNEIKRFTFLPYAVRLNIVAFSNIAAAKQEADGVTSDVAAAKQEADGVTSDLLPNRKQTE